MSKVPDDLKYTETHSWLRTEASGVITVGVTDFAQYELGSIVYVEPPRVGKTIEADDLACTIESPRTAADYYMPASGEIVAVNEELGDSPDDINKDAYAAWIYRIKPSNPLTTVKLLDAAAYRKLTGG